MEIGPILRALRHNKVRAGLLVLEIAFTVAIVLNSLQMIADQLQRVGRDSGLDEDNIAAVDIRPWGADYSDDERRSQLVDRDLDSLRALPGSIDASAMSPLPLVGGGSSFQVKPLGAPPEELVRAPVYTADDHVASTLGLEVVAGRTFTPEDLPVGDGPQILNMLITRDLADALFPEGDALGKTIDTGSAEYPDVVVGIVDRMVTPYGGGPMESRIAIYPGKPARASRMRYLVRAEPGALEQVLGEIETALLANQQDRLIEVRPLTELKAGGYLENVVVARVLTVVIVLLLLVTALGIFGTTSYSVSQRTKQIGTRRALGASRGRILLHFLIESTLITALGGALGVLGAYGLNVALVSHVDGTPLSPRMALLGLALLLLLTLGAAAVPARRAAGLSPAIATRTV